MPDDGDRDRIEAETANNRWPTRELERQVHLALHAALQYLETSLHPPLEPLRGRIDVVCGVDLPPAGRLLDLGFTLYARLSDLGLERAPLGDVVKSRQDQRYTVRATSGRKVRYYTYLAQVERVIDGDALLLQIQPIYGAFI